MAELAGDGIDLRRADGSVWWWIQRGWIDDPALVDGTDDVIAQAEGRVLRGRKRRVKRIDLRGQVKGLGATPAAADAAHRALIEELSPLFFNLAVDPWPLVVADEYRGLAVGETATINVRPVNVVPDAGLLSHQRIYTVTLETVSSPPEWTFAP